MSVGAELRAARERAGLTIEQIANRTKIQPSKIEALEHDQFETLPHGIYLDGMVRAYAKEVAVEPEPFVLRIRDERVRVIHDLYAAPSDLSAFHSEELPTSEPVPPVLVSPPPQKVEPPKVDPRPAIVAAPPENIQPPPPALRPPKAPVSPPSPDLFLRDIAPPLAPEPHGPAGSADSARRLGLIALTLSLLAAIGWIAYFYQGNRPFSRSTSEVQTSTPPSSAPAAVAVAPAPRAPAPEPAAYSVGTAGSVSNVSGSWTLATKLESSNYARFSGLQLGYEIQLKQTGDRVTGAGRKVTENSRGIRGRARTPISVAGTLEGNRLTLNFTERGARRPTQGKFVLLLEEDGAMRGRFSSSAAQSAGTVEARRIK